MPAKNPEMPLIPINPRASEAYFKSLAENLPHFMAILDPENFKIKSINRAQDGFTVEDIIGKEIFDFILIENKEIYIQKLEELKQTGNTLVLDVESASKRYPSGKAWYHANISIIYGEENSVEAILVVYEDISEKKLKEIENINARERINAIINNTSDIICSIDNNYNLLEFNNTFEQIIKKGFGIELISGKPIFEFIDPQRHESLKVIYARVQQGETCNDVSRFLTKSGLVLYNETSFNPIYNSEKQISGISIFSKDITERVKNEQKTTAALKEKEVLLAEIHHRIKNNLAMVSGLLELQEMNINNTEAKEALAQSRKRIKSTALIHELLYRSESFQNINLKDYLSELFQHLKINDKVQLVLKGNDVNLNLTTAMPLGLMINEIMLNSFKHSHKDGTEGKTEIELISNSNSLVINYCDCKGNFPVHIDFKNSKTTGLALIHTFAAQLDGSIELICNAPPKYKIQIPTNDNQ